jgi:6-phosphogluconolactonase
MPYTIEYRVSPTSESLAVAAAEFFVASVEEAVQRRRVARVAVSGGSTPRAMFAALAEPTLPFLKRMPWEALELYWVDERCVPPTDAESNYRMTREVLLEPLEKNLAALGRCFRPGQVHRMEGELEPVVAAARYESELRNSFKLEGAETPRFDLIALGMGPDGHTASIFPETQAIYNFTELVTANAVPQKNTTRITLTWPVINQGSRVFFLIAGADKAAVLREVLLGAKNPELLPAQLIRPANGILTLLLDQAAAAELPPTDENGCGRVVRD